MAGWGLLSGVLSWRRASAVVAGLVLAFGGLGVATAAVTDRPTVPQVTVSYNGVELQNCWDTTSCPQIAVMGESVTVTLAATSPDVVRFQYGFVGGGVETVDGSTATLTLFPRQEGYNRLQVVSINSIGQPSEQLDFMFNVAPRPGPVGSWTFDDGSGTTAADGPGLTHPLTLSGGAAFDGKGRLNGAVALDGVNDVVQATDPVVDTSKSFSIAAWARPTSSTKNGVVAAITGTNSSAFGLYYDAASKRWVFARTSADVRTPTLYRAASKEAPINGAWTHLTGTYDVTTGNLQLFVNGRLQQTTTSPVAPAWKAAGPLTIGRGKYAAADTGYFAGSLDQIKLWQRPLVAEEVPALADPRTPDEPVSALAAHWPLDSATRGTDHVWRTAESIRGADLQLTGFGSTADQSGAFVNDPERGQVLEMTGKARESLSVGRPIVDGSSSFTVGVMVKIADPSKPMVIARQSTSTKDAWRLEYKPLDAFTAQWVFARSPADSSAEVVATYTTDLDSVSGWHLLLGTYDAAHPSVLQGSPAGAIKVTVDIRGGDGSLATYLSPTRFGTTTVIGAARTTAQPFNGRLDELRIYAGVLSQRKACTDYPDLQNCGS